MKKIDMRGFAHLALLAAVIVVVGVGGIGYYVYTKSKAASVAPPAPLSIEINPSDWQLTGNSKLVTDPEQGQVLELTKTGLADDNITLASLKSDDAKLAQLNTFEYNMYNARQSSYYMRTCVTYKTTLTNQDISKFPFVSTYQIRSSSGVAINFLSDPHTSTWTVNKCSNATGSVTVQLSKNFLLSQNRASTFTKYNGMTLTGRTFLPDQADANPPAAGKAYLGKITVTVSPNAIR